MKRNNKIRTFTFLARGKEEQQFKGRRRREDFLSIAVM
jgi:hypothetical protein